MHIFQFLIAVYVLGYLAQLLSMILETHTHNTREKGLRITPTYHEEDYLVLPAMWPWYAFRALKEML